MNARLNGGPLDGRVVDLGSPGVPGRVVYPGAGSYVWRGGSRDEPLEFDFQPRAEEEK